MKAIKLPAFFINGVDIQMVELGIKTNEDCEPEIRTVLFYQIIALSPYYFDGNKHTCIHTASGVFICPKAISEVEQILKSHDEPTKDNSAAPW